MTPKEELEKLRGAMAQVKDYGLTKSTTFTYAEMGVVLAKIDADAIIIAELEKKLKYTSESRDAHSTGWTNCVIELGETRVELKKCRNAWLEKVTK